MSRKSTHLGELAKGRVFYYNGTRYKVVANLGVAGVSVKSMAKREVQIGQRVFKSHDSATAVWSAGSIVEVNAKQENVDGTQDQDYQQDAVEDLALASVRGEGGEAGLQGE